MTASIMIQGTQSDAGKSLVAAGLCRVFHQDGFKAIPFKSQNMSLNAYVTTEGYEMAIAQAVQAEAAGLQPDIRMNPIMLKPTSDHLTQVILNGKPWKTMEAADYFNRKPDLLAPIQASYASLAREGDVMVIEGAGSPAEINLNDHDIVNMGLAQALDAPVILVGNIDLGGVFASLYGTVMLQPPEDRARIKGLLINKFRGDQALLQDGLDRIEDLTGIPVLGVLPYKKLDIQDEDSVAIDHYPTEKDPTKDLDLAILVLPWISNFSDFKSLEGEADVSLRCVFKPDQLGKPDLLILPDSRAFGKSLDFLAQNGLADKVRALVQAGTHILGLGGGGLLLARHIRGEKAGGGFSGLGILPVDGRLTPGDRPGQGEAEVFFPRGDFQTWQGPVQVFASPLAEIDRGDLSPFAQIRDWRGQKLDRDQGLDGAVSPDGHLVMTKLHGLFDHPAWRRAYLNWVRAGKGLAPIQELAPSYRDYKEGEYDKLADLVRENLDMEAIYRICGLK